MLYNFEIKTSKNKTMISRVIKNPCTIHNKMRTFSSSHEESRGFVEADNSGRSNIFSTGEKALYSYSPVAEDAARRGLGGNQGLGIIIAVIVVVGIITAGVTTEKESIETWSIASAKLDSLTE